MNNRLVLVIILVLAFVVIVGIVRMGNFKEEPIINDNDNDVELTVVEKELDRLPFEVTVRDRTVVLDRDSIVPELREEYARLPYEVEIGEETRLVETDFQLGSGETPIEFVERIIDDLVPLQDELDLYPEEMYQLSVSFYPLDEDVVAEYPVADRPDADPAEEGLSAYVRLMNFPDDSIGGNESRYDFIVSEGGGWIMVWIGERTFCRRPGQEFWQPADQLCP